MDGSPREDFHVALTPRQAPPPVMKGGVVNQRSEIDLVPAERVCHAGAVLVGHLSPDRISRNFGSLTISRALQGSGAGLTQFRRFAFRGRDFFDASVISIHRRLHDPVSRAIRGNLQTHKHRGNADLPSEVAVAVASLQLVTCFQRCSFEVSCWMEGGCRFRLFFRVSFRALSTRNLFISRLACSRSPARR